MNKLDVERIKKEIDIADLVSQSFQVIGFGHTRTTAEHDSLRIFTNTNSWTWYSESGKNGKALGGSVIDWYMHIHGCSFKIAASEMLDSIGGGSLRKSPTPSASQKTPKAVQDDAWRQRAMVKFENGVRQTKKNHPLIVDYLVTKRGLELDICASLGIGLELKKAYGKDENDNWLTAPAVQFPYFDLDGNVTGIRYRYLEKIRGNRIISLTGSRFPIEFNLYNLIQRGKRSNALFIIEGETNGASIAQHGFDMVSVGSESATLSDDLIEWSQRYDHIYVWFDKFERSESNVERIGRGTPIRSLQHEGKELDANDLLKAGVLGEVLLQIAPNAIPVSQVIEAEPVTEEEEEQRRNDNYRRVYNKIALGTQQITREKFPSAGEAEEFANLIRENDLYLVTVNDCTVEVVRRDDADRACQRTEIIETPAEDIEGTGIIFVNNEYASEKRVTAGLDSCLVARRTFDTIEAAQRFTRAIAHDEKFDIHTKDCTVDRYFAHDDKLAWQLKRESDDMQIFPFDLRERDNT